MPASRPAPAPAAAPVGYGGGNTPRLFTAPRHAVRRRLLWRLGFVLGLVLFILLVLWLDRGGLRDQIDGHVSFTDVVYFTAVTVTTVGYGDIVPVTERARLVDTLIVTPARLVLYLVFLGTAYEFLLQRIVEEWRMKRLQAGLAGHVVVCGYGRSGVYAAREAAHRGHTVLVIEPDAEKAQRAADDGHVGLRADATLEASLTEAAIGRAAAVLVCVGRDDTAVLVTLTARSLAPRVRVVANVADEENVKLMRQAGADATVMPAQVGGHLMADAVATDHLVDYVVDLLTLRGDVVLVERPPRPDEVGRSLREIAPDLAVRLVRDGTSVDHRDPPARQRVQAGDTLLVIQPTGPGTGPDARDQPSSAAGSSPDSSSR